MPSNQITGTATTLKELLSFYDESFIHCAYRSVLGRAPDPEGLDFYLKTLRAGIEKIEILSQIRRSEEGISRQAIVAGLDEAIRRHQKLKAPLLGAALRFFGAKPVDGDAFQKLRAIENKLHEQGAQVQLQLVGMNSVLWQLKKQIESKKPAAVALAENSHPAYFDAAWYLDQYPDVAASGMDPYDHYVHHGKNEGRFPAFDSDWYLLRYPEVAKMGLSPREHYINVGKLEGRFPGYSPRKGAAKFISVIIPTYNRIKLLPGVIDAWHKVHACTPFSYEILFSDDGSSDGSIEYLESVKGLPLKVLRNAHGGASSARNAAIRAAVGERLLIMGDDIFPNPNLLKIHAELAQQMGAKVGVLGTVDWHPELKVNHLMHHITEIGNEQFSYNRLKDSSFTDFRHFYTCNISIDRLFLLQEEVIFDERFDTAAFEDVELGYRLALRGLKLFYTTLASGAHYHPYTAAGFSRRQSAVGKMAVVFSNIHPGLENVLGVRSLSAKARKDRKSIGQNEIWQSRVDMLIRRCDVYEQLVAELPTEISLVIRQILSAIYRRLFRAMYEYGVLEKLGTHPDALANCMAQNFEDAWAKYWKLLAKNIDQPIDFSAKEIHNLAKTLITGSSADPGFGTKLRAIFDELLQVKALIDFQQVVEDVEAEEPIATPLQPPAVVETALPGLILEPNDKDHEGIITAFRAIFGNAARVYERTQGDFLQPYIKNGKRGSPVLASMAEANIFYWPTSPQAIPLGDHLLSAYMSLIENGLDLAVISNSLISGQLVSVSELRDHTMFSRNVAKVIFESELASTPFRGKVLRLLPGKSTVSEKKLDILLGTQVDIDGDGFFANRLPRVKPALFNERYLPVRSKSKPVVFVFPIFLAVGGVERNTVEIMRQLNAEYDFVVITMERLRPEQGSLAAQAIEVAAKVIEMPEIVPHSGYLRLLSQLQGTLQPDLIWVCNGSPWFCDNAAAIRNIFCDVPIIDQEVYDVEQGWIARYMEPGIRSFDRFIAVNKKIEERFLRDFAIDPASTQLIYSAVDTSRIRHFKQRQPAPGLYRKKYGLPENKQLFTFIGRLTQQKQPLEFLRLAKERIEHAAEYFVLVGDGELSLEAQAFISRHHLKNVTHIPYIENTLELHSISDGIIFTSAYEGLPIAMIEALAMGVPAFSTDVGDIADVLAEYAGGSVVPVNVSKEGWNSALADWIKRRKEYANNLRNHENAILDRFSSANIAKQYDHCWKTAMEHYERKVA